MNEDYQTVMPWTMYAEMDTFDIEAVYDYLMSLEPINNQVTRMEMKK
jgi:hypothetical protein